MGREVVADRELESCAESDLFKFIYEPRAHLPGNTPVRVPSEGRRQGARRRQDAMALVGEEQITE